MLLQELSSGNTSSLERLQTAVRVKAIELMDKGKIQVGLGGVRPLMI